jgi:hypothetical protein
MIHTLFRFLALLCRLPARWQSRLVRLLKSVLRACASAAAEVAQVSVKPVVAHGIALANIPTHAHRRPA